MADQRDTDQALLWTAALRRPTRMRAPVMGLLLLLAVGWLAGCDTNNMSATQTPVPAPLPFPTAPPPPAPMPALALTATALPPISPGNADRMTLLRTLTWDSMPDGPYPVFNNIAFTPDGQTLAALTGDTVMWWRVADGARL